MKYSLDLGFCRNRRKGISPIPGMIAWYKADTLPLGAISSWPDFSGNGNDTGTQGTSTARPTATASQLNNRTVAIFDGGDSLAIPAAIYSTTPNGNNTIFVVSKRNTETGSQEIIFGATESSSVRWQLRYTATSGAVAYWNSTSAPGTEAVSTSNTNTNFNIIRASVNGATLSVSVNNTNTASNSNAVAENGINSAFLGTTTAASSWLIGGIAEVIIYNRFLSSAEVSQVQNYLSKKWGITLS